MAKMVALKEIAKVLRSKNAGPFEVTFDIVFKNKEDYQKFINSGAVTPELIANLYQLPKEKILTFCGFEAANAFKITIPRRRNQGSIGETDMHAAQQYAPLLNIMIPWE